MGWYDFGAWILLLVFAVPVLYVLYFFAGSLWAMFRASREAKKPPVFAETRLGRLGLNGDSWTGEISTDSGPLTVNVQDRAGEPNPEFLERAPGIVAELGRWVALAREHSDVSPKHKLDSLDDGFPSADFVLGFSYDENGWGETVFFSFADGRVIDVSTVD